jgi:hypothetical protein
MNQQGPVILDDRRAMLIRRLPPCAEIECTDGVVWVTFSGDPVDYILRKGDRLVTGKVRNAVFSAMGTARFSVTRVKACREGSALRNLRMAASS